MEEFFLTRYNNDYIELESKMDTWPRLAPTVSELTGTEGSYCAD